MKLNSITVHKELTRKLTIKGKLGGFKSDETTGGITMTFDIEDGEHLRSETEIAIEANDKVREALSNLMDPDEAKWLREKTPARNDPYNPQPNSEGYMKAKGSIDP